VEDAINNGYMPLSYSHFPLPIIGYLFNLAGIPREVISYEGGATLAVQTNGQGITNISIGDVLLIINPLEGSSSATVITPPHERRKQ
jgi:hypothetical protein